MIRSEIESYEQTIETYTAKVRKGKWIEGVVGNAAAGRGVVAARIRERAQRAGSIRGAAEAESAFGGEH